MAKVQSGGGTNRVKTTKGKGGKKIVKVAIRRGTNKKFKPDF